MDYNKLYYNKRYVDWDLLKLTSINFQKQYQKWWENNYKIGDLYNLHDEYCEKIGEGVGSDGVSHQLYEKVVCNSLNIVKEDDFKKYKIQFTDFLGSEIIGLPTETTLREFIKYNNKSSRNIYGILNLLKFSEEICNNNNIHNEDMSRYFL